MIKICLVLLFSRSDWHLQERSTCISSASATVDWVILLPLDFIWSHLILRVLSEPSMRVIHFSAFERGQTVLIDECCIIDDYISVPSVVHLSVVTGLCISTAACRIYLFGFPDALIDVMTNSDFFRCDCQNVNRTNRLIIFYCHYIWQTLRVYFPSNMMKLLPLGVLVCTTCFCPYISCQTKLCCFRNGSCMHWLQWPLSSIISHCLFSLWASPFAKTNSGLSLCV